jgi:tyrosinase
VPISASIAVAGEIDFYRFSRSASATVHGYTTGSTDTYCYLQDASGLVLDNDDDDGPGANCHVSASIATGTFYLKVRHFNGSNTGSYVAKVDLVGP